LGGAAQRVLVTVTLKSIVIVNRSPLLYAPIPTSLAPFYIMAAPAQQTMLSPTVSGKVNVKHIEQLSEDAKGLCGPTMLCNFAMWVSRFPGPTPTPSPSPLH